MRSITPGSIATKDLHQFILGAVAPRPIAFASTIDENGVANIAPYSFFNAFSSNPPILVFSSNRRVEDNTTKDTLRNVRANGEVVINVVNYNMVRQMAIAGISYPANVSEFAKSGLTPLASELVKPFRIQESPVQFECKVQEVVTLGEHGGAGHLVLCHVVRLHVAEDILDERGRIDPHKIDLVGRMGRAHYVRASGNAVFDIYQEPNVIALGFDQLPTHIRESKVLSGNEIAQIAGQTTFPTDEELAQTLADHPHIKDYWAHPEQQNQLHLEARKALEANQPRLAFCILMLGK